MEKLTKRESRFCVEYVNGYDRYRAYEEAGYKAKTKEAAAATVSRLLRRPRVKEAIAELEDAIQKSALVTAERIIANIAGIAFDEEASRTDRIRASELLGKNKKLWSDAAQGSEQSPEIHVHLAETDQTPEERRQAIADRNAG